MTRLAIPYLLLLVLVTASPAAALSAGDILLTDFDSSAGRILQYGAQSHTLTTITTNLSKPFGIAIGPTSDVYVVDAGTPPTVLRVNTDTGTTSPLSSGGLLSEPYGLTVTSDGSIFVADQSAGGGGAVIKINPVTGQQTIISSGGHPLGISADLQDRLAIARFGRIDLVNQNGSTIWSSPVTNFFAAAVCVDASNTVYAWGADLTGTVLTKVLKYSDVTGAAVVFADLTTPYPGGFAAGAAGDLYLSDPSADILFKLGSDTSTAPLVFPGVLSNSYGVAVSGVRLGVVDAKAQTWGAVKAAYRK